MEKISVRHESEEFWRFSMLEKYQISFGLINYYLSQKNTLIFLGNL